MQIGLGIAAAWMLVPHLDALADGLFLPRIAHNERDLIGLAQTTVDLSFLRSQAYSILPESGQQSSAPSCEFAFSNTSTNAMQWTLLSLDAGRMQQIDRLMIDLAANAVVDKAGGTGTSWLVFCIQRSWLAPACQEVVNRFGRSTIVSKRTLVNDAVHRINADYEAICKNVRSGKLGDGAMDIERLPPGADRSHSSVR